MTEKHPEAPIDLHTHTTASDGSNLPEKLVELASRRGLAAIAVTDHDTVDGVPAAQNAGPQFGVEVVAGVEISAAVGEIPGVMHILGYFIDVHDEALTRSLGWMRARRKARNPEIIRRLNGLGIGLTLAEVETYAGGGQVGRPHIARALVDRGVVASIQEAFDRYLRKGGPASVEKEKLAPDAAIRAIRGAGGVAVLAHPYQLQLGDGDALEACLRSLVEKGLGGIECHYICHTPARTRRYLELARKYGLAVSGGSDFHGDTTPDIPLGLALEIPYRLIDGLREKCIVGGAF